MKKNILSLTALTLLASLAPTIFAQEAGEVTSPAPEQVTEAPQPASSEAKEEAANQNNQSEDIKSWQEFSNLPIETRKNFNQKLMRAQTLFNQKRIFDTLQEVDELEKIFPSHPAALNIRAACYVEIRAFDKAMPIFEQVLKLNPDSINIKFNLAELDFVTKRWESAHNRFDQLIKVMPESQKSMARLCEFKLLLCKLKMNRVDEAIALMNKYDEWDDSPFYYYSRAALKYFEQDKESADKLLLNARVIWGSAAALSSWQDTMIEFGYVRSFYGGETEKLPNLTEDGILVSPEPTPRAIPLDNQ